MLDGGRASGDNVRCMTETDAAFLAEITDQPATPPDPEPPCRVLRGDVLEVLRGVESDRFHAVLCDPPYGLSEPLHGEDAAQVLAQWMAEGEYVRTKGRKKPAKPGGTDATSRLAGGGFMGAQWDSFVPGPRVWSEVLRVTRPGGYLLAFAGSRTSGWMEIALMLAGWEVLDTIQWWYAEGFPKGGNVGKRVDALLGSDRPVVGSHPNPAGNREGGASLNMSRVGMPETANLTDPATGEGAIWDDWSTTLKPAHEPIIVARRPLGEKSVAANLLRWRTGALNIGACRVPAEKATGWGGGAFGGATWTEENSGLCKPGEARPVDGRWPANLMLTHSEACGNECVDGCPVRLLDEQGGERKSGSRAAGSYATGATKSVGIGFGGGMSAPKAAIPASVGGASRFFFCAKASPADRDEGLGMEAMEGRRSISADGLKLTGSGNPRETRRRNPHPTVKPVPLIRELARLITSQPVAGWAKDGEVWRWEDRPPGEVLVPFAGSGSEVVACALEGLRAVGIEREAEYHVTAEARVAHALQLVAEGRCPKHWRRRGE